MRWLLVCLLAAVSTLGQQTLRTYTYDLNGRPVPVAESVARKDSHTIQVGSINGGSVPLERVDQREIRSDANGKTVERIVRRYTPEGQIVAEERVLVEEAKTPEGSTVRTSRFQEDANGASTLIERSTAKVRRDGAAGSASDVTIERPSVDGALQTAERRVIFQHQTGSAASSSEIVYRPDANGRLTEIARETSDRRTVDGRTIEQTQRYQANAEGKFALAESSTRRSVKRPDGSESEVVDVYSPFTPGLANNNGPPKMNEQRIIERRVVDGNTVESVSVRRPGLSDPNRLGEAQKISEIVCTGKCER